MRITKKKYIFEYSAIIITVLFLVLSLATTNATTTTTTATTTTTTTNGMGGKQEENTKKMNIAISAEGTQKISEQKPKSILEDSLGVNNLQNFINARFQEQEREENERRKRLQSKKNDQKVLIGIVDTHGTALHVWNEALESGKIPTNGKGLPLIHIDSHADCGLPNTKNPISRISDNLDHNLDMKQLEKIETIVNFIPIAQYVELLSNQVFWIRDDWRGQRFNMPFGQYNVSMGSRLRPKNKESTICWYRRDQYQKFAYIGQNLQLCSKYIKKDPTIPVMDAQWHVINGQKREEMIEYIVNNITFYDDTINKKQFSYILDIDEDYFASDEPTVLSFLPYHRFGPLFALFEDILKPGKEICLDMNLSSVPQWQKLETLVVNIFWKGLTFLPNSKHPIVLNPLTSSYNLEEAVNKDEIEEDKKKILESYSDDILDYWCKKDKVYAYNQLVRLSNLVAVMMKQLDFVKLYALQMEIQFPQLVRTYDEGATSDLDKVESGALDDNLHECRTNGYFGICMNNGEPIRNTPNEKYVLKMISHIVDLIKALKRPPAAISIARSVNNYTPVHVQPFIETQLLRALTDVLKSEFNLAADITYFEDLDPVDSAETIPRDIYDISPKEVQHMREKLLDAIQDDDLEQLHRVRQNQLRTVSMVSEYFAAIESDHDDVHMLSKHFLRYRLFRAEILKNITNLDLEHDLYFRLNSPPLSSNETTRVCYVAAATKTDDDFSELSCWFNELSKDGVKHSIDNKETKMVLKLQTYENMEEYAKLFSFSEKKAMLLSSRFDVGKKTWKDHKKSPLIYKQANCIPENSKYIGTLDEFIKHIQPLTEQSFHSETSRKCKRS